MLSTKKTILIFIDWFYPGFKAGGPVQSIVSLVANLGTTYDLKVITSDRDLNSKEAYPNIESNVWTRSALGCDVYYAKAGTLHSSELSSLLKNTKFDLVYINSFFSTQYSILPLRILNKNYASTPVILAPRGMLGEGALAIKRTKKKLFLVYSKLSGLHTKVIWHATSEQEANEIKHVFGTSSKLIVIPNIPKTMGKLATRTKESGHLKACFVSRISPKKNLKYALERLRGVQTGELEFGIYGLIEDEHYWAECQAVMSDLPKHIKVQYKGVVAPEQIEKVLSANHLMILPTLNENFGHSIVESLLCGCPVLISDQTPWLDVAEQKAGFALKLKDDHKFVEAIEHFVAMNQSDFDIASAGAHAYISKKLNLEETVTLYQQAFNASIQN